jgi:NADH-quinone oxidoreductase subunit M
MAFVIAVLPKKMEGIFKYISLGVNAVVLLLVFSLIASFSLDGNGLDAASYQFVERFTWFSVSLSEFGVFSSNYYLGVDGLSFAMIILTSVVMLIGNIASFSIKKNQKAYYFLFLLLTTSVYGCFVSLDMLLFYVFFEFMLLPMYFLIGMWGGPRREYASIKFFLYTLVGSIFILIVMIGLNLSVVDLDASIVSLGFADSIESITPLMKNDFATQFKLGGVNSEMLVHTFDIPLMMDDANYIPGSVFAKSYDVAGVAYNYNLWGVPLRYIAFLALFIGFAIKLPAVPFHTWLPDAHVEAPTSISVVLAGILLKVGGYGLIRLGYSIFPDGAVEYSYLVALMGMISIVYGAYNALAMTDLKKMIAYSSVSHMGFVLLGLASCTIEGVSGAIYQLFSHGIISSLLFVVVGVIYERTHDRTITSYRGVANKMPFYTAVVIIAFFASIGLPGFSGFIAEIFVFIGSFKSGVVNDLVPRWMVVVSLFGLILGAAYYLWTIQRMFFGEFWVKTKSYADQMTDLTTREYVMVIPLILLALYFGIFPSHLLDIISPMVNAFVNMMNSYV